MQTLQSPRKKIEAPFPGLQKTGDVCLSFPWLQIVSIWEIKLAGFYATFEEAEIKITREKAWTGSRGKNAFPKNAQYTELNSGGIQESG